MFTHTRSTPNIELDAANVQALQLRHAIVNTARALKDKPFVEQGTGETGYDCRGLIITSYQAHGWKPLVPEITLNRQYKMSDGRKLLRVLEAECDKMPATQAQPADIVLMRNAPDELPVHIGMLTNLSPVLYVIHTSYELKKVTEHHIPPLEMWRVASFWKVKEMF